MASLDASSPGFWAGKRVLVTGHTGFKGSWLCYWLHRLGAHVTGFARPPATRPSLYEMLGLSDLVDSHWGEITDAHALQCLIKAVRPEMVFHLAAQAQVVPSYAQPEETFSTNVMGTVVLLDAIRTCTSVRVCQIVTSDKCYAQPGSGQPFAESDALGGRDPYSASKAAAELVAAAFRDSFFAGADACSIATVRAGNAVGAGDWSEQRLFPNAVRALMSEEPVHVTQPHAVRPWQYVLEPLSGYLWLARHQYQEPKAYAQAWNFGPEEASAVCVHELVQMILEAWGAGALHVDANASQWHEEPYLKISIAKARSLLAWQPAYDLRQTVRATVQGYQHLYGALRGHASPPRARSLLADAIAAYAQCARDKGIAWAQDRSMHLTGGED